MAEARFYKTIDHTADTGIEVVAPDLESVFTNSALAMTDMMFGLASIGESATRRVSVSGRETEELLVAWLNDLLYVYDVERLVFSRFSDAVLNSRGFSALGLGEGFDARRHEACMEIKAATYHGLSIIRDGDIWKARIIFDI